MQIHLLALPNAPTSAAYPLDGFAQLHRRFATVLQRLGYHVILYGHDENDAPCQELVVCLTTDERKKFIGESSYQNVPFVPDSPLFKHFNTQATHGIQQRKQTGDVIATLGGYSQWQIGQQHPELLFLEYSIGYQGVCGPYRIFQSHAWRHTAHGFTGLDMGRAFDDVIPPFWDVTDFPERAPEPYVAYCGRLVPNKGISIVCDAAKAAGVRLILMGHGDEKLVTYGDYRGDVTTADRNELLAKASAVLMPTQYIEPFGQVAAEAQLCGTPMITSDFGAFVETVEHGKTGYRCRYLGEYVQAIHAAVDLDRAYIRRRAQALWSMDTAVESYRTFFDRLALVHEPNGLNSLTPSRRVPQPALVAA